MSYPLPANESKRLKALELSEILDTEAEQEFDDLTRLAAQICRVPISLISLIDANRQWFKSESGLGIKEMPRDVSFCAHTIVENELFIIPNATEDARFAANPLVTGDPNIRFYAGAPLVTDDGEALGTLCVIDTVPRRLRPEQKESLRALARLAMRLLKVRKEANLLVFSNQEIKAREENYRIVSESASDAIITINEATTIVFANKAVEKIFGYATGELIGSQISLIIPGQMRGAHSDEMRRYMETGQRNTPWSGIALAARGRDGREIQIEMSFGEYHQNGKRLFTAVIRDITERQIVETKLRESEKNYRFLAEAVPQQVWTALPDGRLDYGNYRTVEYFGKKAVEELLDFDWLKVLHPDDIPTTTERWSQSLEKGEPYENEFRLRRADGEYHWHLAQALAMRDENNQIIKWFGTNTDIHERKLAAEKLRKSEEYRNLFRHANDAIIIFELESEIVIEVNEKACRLYGVEHDDFLGKSIKEMSENVERGETQLQQLLEKGSIQSFETIQFHSDGTAIDLLINSSVVEYDGRPVVLSINRDITERKQVEKALSDSEERLQQSQKMEAIGTLTGGVAHDFNNLLTSILGNAQLALRNTSATDPVRNRLTEIENAGNRAAVLTRQLLAFSRRQHLDRRNINLNQTITEIMKLLNRIIGEDVAIAVKYAFNLDTVFADPAQIEQIIMNLSVNARDAMPNGGELSIETSNVELDENYCRQYPYVQPGKYAEIKVSDTGEGIDKETQARIYEPFFTTKETGKGTGLGLSMVYGIVKQHDGHINLYSEVGHGTIFKIYLPVVNSVVDEEKEMIRSEILGGTETILVAEDEESLRNLAKDILESLGYTVLLAKNGEEAVSLFAAHRTRIDMLLFDVVMPRLNGSEAYRQICRLEGRDIPLLMMTGYSSETVQNRFVKQDELIAGIKPKVIQKPYNVELLGRTVREILDK